MAREHRSEQHNLQQVVARRRGAQLLFVSGGCTGVLLAAFPLPLIYSMIPRPLMAQAAGLLALILQVFQGNDRVSTWLAFALVWIACALVALSSAYVVFQVAETRKRLVGR